MNTAAAKSAIGVWVDACATDDIDEEDVIRFDHGGRVIAIYRPDDDQNYNESRYYNWFDHEAGMGGWVRMGNRVNEGYAELSVCLYLPDGSMARSYGELVARARRMSEDAGRRVATVAEARRMLGV